MGSQTTCLLCGSNARITYAAHPGYREDMRFDIAECPQCATAFALPLAATEALYDTIYQNIECVPGYARYQEHMNAVRAASEPLEYLTAAEESYWAIARCIEHRTGQRSRAETAILEIGSGLGYLTYSLCKAGYAATGLELSQQAVEQATRVFGPYYRLGTIDELAQSPERYDFIVLSQVIEHVTDVLGLIAGALRLLAPGGQIILTTPNRSAFAPDVIWETELPPIHLWWFSEQSFRHIAQRLACEASFTDFTDFHSRTYRSLPPVAGGMPTRAPILDAGHRIRQPEHPSRLRQHARRLLITTGLQLPLKRLLSRGSSAKRLTGATGLDICVALSPRA